MDIMALFEGAGPGSIPGRGTAQANPWAPATVPHVWSLHTPSRVQIPSVTSVAVAKWPKAQTLNVCMVPSRSYDLRGRCFRMWESVAIRRLGVPESVGSNPTILT
jgi:hypothetical protein